MVHHPISTTLPPGSSPDWEHDGYPLTHGSEHNDLAKSNPSSHNENSQFLSSLHQDYRCAPQRSGIAGKAPSTSADSHQTQQSQFLNNDQSQQTAHPSDQCAAPNWLALYTIPTVDPRLPLVSPTEINPAHQPTGRRTCDPPLG